MWQKHEGKGESKVSVKWTALFLLTQGCGGEGTCLKALRSVRAEESRPEAGKPREEAAPKEPERDQWPDQVWRLERAGCH